MSLAIRMAQERDLPRLTDIWMQAFGDSRDYVSLFYQTNFSRLTTFVRTESDVPIGMMHLVPGHVVCGDAVQPCYLGYAFAVDAAWRGKRVLRDVFDDVFSLCRQQQAALLVKPVNETVCRYYQELGMTVNAHRSLRPVDAVGKTKHTVAFSPITAEDYTRRRNAAFSGAAFLRWDVPHVDWSIAENAFCGGTTETVTVDGTDYFIMSVPDGETRRIIETDVPPALLGEIADTLLRRYSGRRLVSTVSQTDNSGTDILLSYGCNTPEIYTNLIMI